MGHWVAESGMHLHLDVYRHHPLRSVADGAYDKGIGLVTRVANSSLDNVPSLREEEQLAKEILFGPKLGAAERAKLRNSDAWPDGHSHTSPDGLVYVPRGVYHNKYARKWGFNGKGLLEIKAPGYSAMRTRGRSYRVGKWHLAPLVAPHVPVTYYAFQMMDQMETLSSWPCGRGDTQWVDFVPQWIAHQ